MDFQLVSKNNMGLVGTLILVILLSQSRVFDFLLDTFLGRALLIVFILGISYTNKIIGVVSVLLVIIMVGQSNIGYMEGLKNLDTSNHSSSIPTVTKPAQKDTHNKPDENTITTSTIVSAVDATTVEPVRGREGFNIIDREGTILRGKSSNEVPVLNNARSQDDDVEPVDKSLFTSKFSLFQ